MDFERLFGLIFFVVGCGMFYFRAGLTYFFNEYLSQLSPTKKKLDLKPRDIGLLGIIELMIGIIVLVIVNSDILLSLLE